MNLWQQLLPNLAIVAITTVVWALGRKSLEGFSVFGQRVAFGVLMAGAVLATMSFPFEFTPGVYLDPAIRCWSSRDILVAHPALYCLW